MTVKTATPRTAPPTLRNIYRRSVSTHEYFKQGVVITHVVDTRNSALVLCLCGCHNCHVADKVHRSNTGNIQNHSGKTELPVLTAVAHATEQDYTSQTHQPANYEQIAGANRSQEEGDSEIDNKGSYA